MPCSGDVTVMNLRAIAIPLAAALLLAACDQAPKQQAAPPPPPPPEVGVVTLAPRKVDIVTELPGRTAAFRVAEVRPQVNGIILKRLFEEGSLVEAGQQLYQIDPASYQAAYQSAQAALARASAQSTASRLLAQRYKPLVDAKAVSKQDYDNAVASAQQAAADVASARAQIETARISVEYTKVLAPIAGRVGRSAVSEGALVTANQAAPLATVQQLDPMYVDVTQSTADLLRLRRQMEGGQMQTDESGQAPASSSAARTTSPLAWERSMRGSRWAVMAEVCPQTPRDAQRERVATSHVTFHRCRGHGAAAQPPMAWSRATRRLALACA